MRGFLISNYMYIYYINYVFFKIIWLLLHQEDDDSVTRLIHANFKEAELKNKMVEYIAAALLATHHLKGTFKVCSFLHRRCSLQRQL